MKTKLKTDLTLIPEKYRTELVIIADFISQHIRVDMIVLFGKYAGGTMKSILEGYELLLVSRKEPVNVYEVSHLLNKSFPMSERNEKNVFLYSYSVNYINTNNSANYFLLNIRNQGIVLYDNKTFNFFPRKKFKPIRAYHTVTSCFMYYDNISRTFLDNAQKEWNNRNSCTAALNMGYAAELLFKTAESVFYGQINRNISLVQRYLKTRHFSERLYRQFSMKHYENRRLFNLLEQYRYESCDNPKFWIGQKRYLFCLNKLFLLRQTIRLACLERIDLLNKFKNGNMTI